MQTEKYCLVGEFLVVILIAYVGTIRICETSFCETVNRNMREIL